MQGIGCRIEACVDNCWAFKLLGDGIDVRALMDKTTPLKFLNDRHNILMEATEAGVSRRIEAERPKGRYCGKQSAFGNGGVAPLSEATNPATSVAQAWMVSQG